MEKLFHTVAHVEKQVSEGVIEAVVGSTQVLDRMGEIIDQAGWELKNFQKNPVILWGHNIDEDRPPIGRALKVWVDGEGAKAKLMFKVQFDLLDNFAADIYRKVKDKFISTVSVGFLPLERVDNKYIKNELLELSFVPVPANPEAVVVMREAGLEPLKLEEMFARKNLAPETESWDGPGEMAKAKGEELKEMCAVDELLPHHRASDKAIVFRAVAAGMATVLGAKGGIPEDKRQEAYDHLVKHYKDFDKFPPSQEQVDNQVLGNFEDEIHALTLDREEKHEIRLIKKIIKVMPKQDKPRSVTDKEVLNALKIIDLAITKAMKGGD